MAHDHEAERDGRCREHADDRVRRSRALVLDVGDEEREDDREDDERQERRNGAQEHADGDAGKRAVAE